MNEAPSKCRPEQSSGAFAPDPFSVIGTAVVEKYAVEVASDVLSSMDVLGGYEAEIRI